MPSSRWTRNTATALIYKGFWAPDRTTIRHSCRTSGGATQPGNRERSGAGLGGHLRHRSPFGLGPARQSNTRFGSIRCHPPRGSRSSSRCLPGRSRFRWLRALSIRGCHPHQRICLPGGASGLRSRGPEACSKYARTSLRHGSASDRIRHPEGGEMASASGTRDHRWTVMTWAWTPAGDLNARSWISISGSTCSNRPNSGPRRVAGSGLVFDAKRLGR
jgi:hypothetical protein